MFSFNIPGIIMLLAGALLSNILITISLPPQASLSIGLLAMITVDLFYRWHTNKLHWREWSTWLSPRKGGFVAIAPNWLLGGLMLFLVQLGLL